MKEKRNHLLLYLRQNKSLIIVKTHYKSINVNKKNYLLRLKRFKLSANKY